MKKRFKLSWEVVPMFMLLMVVSLPVSGYNFSPEQLYELFETAESQRVSFPADVLVRMYAVSIPPDDAEFVGGRPGEWIDVIIPHVKLHELSNADIEYEVLIWDVDEYSRSFIGQYRTLAEMEKTLKDLAERYPDITSLYSIGKTYRGRDIWCLEITDNPGVDEGEPGVFYMGLHHAREWPTLEICLYIAEKLTSDYKEDPEVRDVVDNRRLWLVPCVNPDGYYYCHDLGNDWRKNRRYFPEFGTVGVDLNRNYGGSCNGDPWGAWGSVGLAVVSHHSDLEFYCGPSEYSERETQAIRNVFLENDICACITWHTYGELVMWPWGYSTDVQTSDDLYMAKVGREIASRITRDSGTKTYTPYQSAYLYPITGDTTDWAYGYAQYVQGKTLFAYTIEACSSFHPEEVYLDQICAENFKGAFYLLQEAENIRDFAVPRTLPPDIYEMSTDTDGAFTVSWKVRNPDAKPECFQLDELTGLGIVTDKSESGSDLWILDGFSITSSKHRSGSHSYKSRKSNYDVSAMTSLHPIPVTENMKLSFWCSYEIEEEWDYAFVEVSLDGRRYDLLDKFTGSSEGWQYREYDLNRYVGESIFVRFRYTTDARTLEDGFYIDDIYPVARFDSINTLSTTIANNHYKVEGRADGTYYYRVRGYNSAKGWGDFSTLEEIHIIEGENDPPNTPVITGVTSGKPGVEYEYTFISTDPNGDDIYYYIDWGDGKTEEWKGPYASGEEITLKHTWSKKGTYVIKAKTKDTYDAMSGWGTLEISMSKPSFFNTFFRQLMKRIFERSSLNRIPLENERI
jgi:hypothetical protein